MTFHCKINGTDHGPSGTNTLVNIDLDPADFGQVGTFTLYLKSHNGGYDFIPMQEVQVYEETAGNVTFAWCGGVVIDPVASRIKGTNIEVWTIQCADYNFLLDALVGPADDASVIHVASHQSIAHQVSDLVSQLQGVGVHRAIDATSQVADLYNNAGDPLPEHFFVGKSLRTMLSEMCLAAQQRSTALRPRFRIDMQAPGGAIGNPTLYLYDGAINGSPVCHFSDTPTGAQKGIRGEFTRHLEGSALTNRRQSVWYNDPDTVVLTSSDATSAQTYPNPFIDHGVVVSGVSGYGYWMAEVEEDKESTTQAEAQARLDREIAQVKDSRETITFTTTEKIRPGDVVQVTWALRGLSAVAYRVRSARLKVRKQDPSSPIIELTLGQRRLEWFEEGDEGVDVPPVLRPGYPKPPTNPVVQRQFWDYDQGSSHADIAWDPSPDPTVVGYHIVYTYLGRIYHYRVGNITAVDLYIKGAGIPWSFIVYAVNRAGRESPGTITVNDTSTSPLFDVGVYNGSFEGQDPEDPTQAKGWTHSTTGGGAVSRVATASFEGEYAYKLSKAAGGDTALLLSSFNNVRPQVGKRLRLAAYVSSAMPALTIKVYYYDRNGTLLSTAFLANGEPVSNTWTEYSYPTTTPISAAKMKVEVSNTAGSAVDLYIDAMSFRDQVVTDDIGSGAITDSKLGVLTDPTKHQYDIETNPLRWYDASAEYRGTLQYTPPISGDWIRLSSTNPLTDTMLWLQGGQSGTNWIKMSDAGGVAIEGNSFSVDVTGGAISLTGTSFSGTILDTTNPWTITAPRGVKGVMNIDDAATGIQAGFFVNPTLTATGSAANGLYGLRLLLTAQSTSATATPTLIAAQMTSSVSRDHTPTITNNYALQMSLSHGALRSSGTPLTVTNQYGINLSNGSAAWVNIGTMWGILLSAVGASNGTIGTYYGIQIKTPTGPGTITTAYGLYFESFASRATTNYAIYVAGGKNFLASGGAAIVPLQIDGALGQTGHLTDWTNQNGSPLAYVDKGGAMYSARRGGTSNTPGIAAGTGAGSSPSLTLTGNDGGGTIALTTGLAPTASAIVFTVTFAGTYGTNPYVILTPADINSAALSGTAQVYVDRASGSTTTFVVKVGSTALGAGKSYVWHYQVVE